MNWQQKFAGIFTEDIISFDDENIVQSLGGLPLSIACQ